MENSKNINLLYEDIEKFILYIKGLNIDFKREFNFFDACGFPHYENVISNVIAYFIRDSEDFRELFLSSIFSCIELPYDNIHYTDINREHPTEESKRIDLLIETDQYIIAIENKIYSDDKNQPYKEYCDSLKTFDTKDNTKNKVLILLSMFQKESYSDYFKKDKNSIDITFRCINYKDLITKLKENINNYIFNTNIEEFIFFKHFINNLESIMETNLNYTPDQKEALKYILEKGNREKIEQCNNLLNMYEDDIIKKFAEVLTKEYGKLEEKDSGFILSLDNKKIYVGLWLDGSVNGKHYQRTLNSNIVIVGLPKKSYNINEKFIYYTGNYTYLKFDSIKNKIEESLYNYKEFLEEAIKNAKLMIKEIKNNKEIFI